MDSTNVTNSGGPGSPDGDVWVRAQNAPTFSYVATGGIGITGPQHYREDIIDFESTGGVTLGGAADVVFGVYVYEATGGVVIGGILYAIDFCYEATGGITIGGSHPANAYTYTGTGGINTGGQAGFSVPYWHASMSGGIQITDQGTADSFYTVNGRNFYIYFTQSIPGITIGGQAGIATSAPPLYNDTGQGGAVLGGEADCSTSGLPGGQFPYVGTGGSTLSGSATYSADVVPSYSGRGGPTVSGSATCATGYAYTGSGSISIGGYGGTPASTSIILDQMFQWNVNAEIDIDQQFEWSFGNSILYWFQVESCCEPTTCDRFIVNDGGKCQNTTFTIPILAPNVDNVCQQLTQMGITSQICSIKQFSRAAYKTDQAKLTAMGVDQKCNNLTPVPYCELPDCLNFCVDYDINLVFGVSFDTNQQYIGSGGVAIGGSADCEFLFGTGGNTGGGGVTMGGAADVTSSANQGMPGMGGGAQVGGSADVVFSHWNYVGSGGVSVSGLATTTGTGTIHPPTGGFTPTSGSCFPDWLTSLNVTDKFGTFTLDRIAGEDVFMGCRQMTLNTDDATNSPVSAPMRYYFFCGPNDTSWKLQMTYPCESTQLPGAVPGYTCENFDSSPYIWGETPPNETAFLYGTNNNFPIDTMFYFPCYGCPGYTSTVSESYYQAYGIGYAQAGDTGVHVFQTISAPSSGGGGGMGMLSIQAVEDDYVPPGGVTIGGSAEAGVVYGFDSVGVGDLGPEFTAIQMGGSAAYHQSYPVWTYTGTGGINTGGSAVLNTFRTQGGGSVAFGGAADVALGQWNWANNQYLGAQVSGSADCVMTVTEQTLRMMSSEIDENIDIGFYGAITYAQVVLNNQDVDESTDPNVPVLEPPTDTIKTMCDCNAISELIQMQHNLATTGKLQEFLFRNNLAIPTVLQMSYNGVYQSWQTNVHLTGFSADGNATETWNMVFNWQCTSVVGGTDQGSPLWVFSAYLKQNSGGEVFDSRVLLTFSQLGPCQETSTISFNFTTNTLTGVTTTDPRHNTYSTQIQDSIGLFRSPSWMANPILSVVISEASTLVPVTRLPYDYNPIFADT